MEPSEEATNRRIRNLLTELEMLLDFSDVTEHLILDTENHRRMREQPDLNLNLLSSEARHMLMVKVVRGRAALQFEKFCWERIATREDRLRLEIRRLQRKFHPYQ